MLFTEDVESQFYVAITQTQHTHRLNIYIQTFQILKLRANNDELKYKLETLKKKVQSIRGTKTKKR